MPDLGPIIDGRIDRYRPAQTPPFSAISGRRRKQLTVRSGVAGVLLVGAVAGGFAIGGPHRDVQLLGPAAQPSPSPSPPVRVIPSGHQAPSPVDEAAYALWQRMGSQNYTMTTARMCFCVGRGQPVTVTVTDGKLPRGAVGGPELLSIDQLFELILTGKAEKFTATYDPTYGYPTEVVFDNIVRAIDDEQTYTITDYRPS